MLPQFSLPNNVDSFLEISTSDSKGREKSDLIVPPRAV